MNVSDQDKWVIEQYEQDEEMMVLIFAQWCVNHDMDALDIYMEAYPDQQKNKVLLHAIENTSDKDVAEEISTEVLFHVLQNFGNDDLAFVIQDKLDKNKKQQHS